MDAVTSTAVDYLSLQQSKKKKIEKNTQRIPFKANQKKITYRNGKLGDGKMNMDVFFCRILRWFIETQTNHLNWS